MIMVASKSLRLAIAAFQTPLSFSAKRLCASSLLAKVIYAIAPRGCSVAVSAIHASGDGALNLVKLRIHSLILLIPMCQVGITLHFNE